MSYSSRCPLTLLLAAALFCSAHRLQADPPVASFIFPAGGQRGTTVPVRVGGLFVHDHCSFELQGAGVQASKQLQRTPKLWMEGPLLPLPASQQPEDYPQDMAGVVRIDANASLGPRRARLWTAEGAASGPVFVVGDLPEVVEQETEGDPIAVPVSLPVTINGRIFPREDIDDWSFPARRGQIITAEVQAARLGSPLDAHLEFIDSRGTVLAENDNAPSADPRLHFTAPRDGTYRVRIRDWTTGGSPRHVYRLTLTTGPDIDHVYPLGGRRGQRIRFSIIGPGAPANPVEAALPDQAGETALRFEIGRPSRPILVDVDDLPDHVEVEPNDTPARAQRIGLPAVVNGRIDRSGDRDCWSFPARKGEVIDIELRAHRLGSPLQGELAVLLPDGKVLAQVSATQAQPDPVLSFTAPADGIYTARVSDHFASRGGPAFAYRLRLAPPPPPDFQLQLAAYALTLPRGGQAPLQVLCTRKGGFAGPITLTLDDLPVGVKATGLTIPAGQNSTTVTLSASSSAAINATPLTLRGSATVQGRSRTATAMLPGAAPAETVLLAVALRPPFKLAGDYDLRLAQRGTVFRRRYRIDRNGFKGPLEARLADRQARHLQGATGPPVTIPAGASEFEFAVFLPPWMETGRTSRVCIMLVGTVEEGPARHVVSCTSQEQNHQMIAVVETGQLSLELERSTVRAVPGSEAALGLRVRRGKGLTGPVKVELVLPTHVHGVRAEPLQLAADQGQGELKLHFEKGALGPFNMPLVVRAALARPSGPVVAEGRLEVVQAP
jgi:hypothetical protein